MTTPLVDIRIIALQHAVSIFRDRGDPVDEIIESAAKFEEFLRGDYRSTPSDQHRQGA